MLVTLSQFKLHWCRTVAFLSHYAINYEKLLTYVSKGKVFPYSLLSVGSGADPDVQAVSRQVALSYPPGGRLPLLSARPAVTFLAEKRHRQYQIILLGNRGTWVWTICPRLSFNSAVAGAWIESPTRMKLAGKERVLSWMCGVFAASVERPWERAVTSNNVPFYIKYVWQHSLKSS